MRRYSLIALMFATVIILILSGCQSSNQPDQVGVRKVPKELHTFYPGDITQVDSIEMMSGSDGTKKTTTDQVLIQEWIEKVHDLEIVLDPDQEDSTGVLYHVTMFEQGKELLYMTPTDMNHQPIEPQLELADRMSELYDAIE
ncbi:hypothetical protein C161_18039 [Paenibacillus sp. FSL R5-192]|uniref:hypothetical protein n=1 Tax=Paenibacillus sp. FSL R5-192 TaxID=1226754 RepID=UPI0003E21ED1|nr:hypothetical protein [Paenibacillus sp. FSL R5-192]ETT35132.1 hypothetical protein C161_18039 [Paenibacillus sp. FSL R5-192]